MTHTHRPIALSNWLYCVALLVFIMVIVGGVTRLTESGLSITEWKPITGALPPMSEAVWQLEFEKYQQIPEYLEINGPAGMTLAEFKFIYFWEWVHRLLGRLIGLAFALPFAWFAIKRAIPNGYGGRLVALLVLGGMQGVIGWWMVTSGLTERTDVSHFRLATHLLTAFLILGGLVWTALDLRQFARHQTRPSKLTGFGLLVFCVLFVQLLFGAYTAGLNAGYVSNSWPLMNGSLMPAGINWSEGLWTLLNNHPALIHRLVITLHPRTPRRHVGHEVGDFFRCMRFGDVDDAQAVGEPRYGNFGAGDDFTRLMAAGHRRLRRVGHIFQLER